MQPRTGPEWETTESIVGPVKVDSLTNQNHPVSPHIDTRILGLNLHPDTTDLFAWSGTRTDGGPIVDGGPNDNYFYVDSAGHRWDRIYWVNEHIMPTGPVHSIVVTDRTPPLALGSINHWDALLAIDSLANPQALLDGVIAHETYGSPGGAGHQGRMRDAMTGERCGNVNLLLERAVGQSSTWTVLVSEARLRSVEYIEFESADSVETPPGSGHIARMVGNNVANASHVLGQKSQTAGGPHVRDDTLGDAVTFVPPVHHDWCN